MSSSTGQATNGKEDSQVASRAPAGEEAVLEVLQEFQSGLESLRSLYQQRMAMSARLADREEELAKESRRLAGADGEIKKSRSEIDSLRSQIEQARQEIERSRQALEASREELDKQTVELSAREAEVKKTKEAIEAQRKTTEATASQLSQREAAIAERSAEQDALRTRVAEMERSVAESKAALASQQAKAAEQEVALRREVEAAVKSREGSGRAPAGSGEAERALRAEAETLKNKLAALQATAEEHAKAIAAEKAEKQRLTKELTAAQAAPSKGGSDAVALRAEAETLKNKVAALQATAEEHAKAMSAEKAEKQRLTKELAAAQAAPSGSSKGGSDADRAKLEKAAKALIELRSERDELAHQAQRLKKELEGARKAGAASAKATGHNDALLDVRRSRLKRYRALVREQSQKVLKATETLKSRFEHAEKLTAQREQLAAASEKIKIAERKIEGQRSKAKAAALMFYAIGSALVLGVMSWMAADWIAPGTYVASTVVTAQGRGRTLNAAELGEWQSFHQQLVNDPRFHEVVAERMARRGMSELATPGAVRELVTNNINTRSPEDGELVIELRGTGPARTARVLETLTTALASHANGARQQRVDGAVTTIKQAAQAGSEPIDNTRLVWAGMLWIASLVVTGITGWFLWKRLTNAKVSFEKSANVDDLLDQSKWVPPAVATQMRRDRRMLP